VGANLIQVTPWRFALDHRCEHHTIRSRLLLRFRLLLPTTRGLQCQEIYFREITGYFWYYTEFSIDENVSMEMHGKCHGVNLWSEIELVPRL
jgi:hypothetical protein